jgi:hypothetical protein
MPDSYNGYIDPYVTCIMAIQAETKFAHKLLIVGFYVERRVDNIIQHMS